MPGESFATELAKFSLPILADSLGPEARIIAALKPLQVNMRVAGPAYTIAGTADDNLALHRGLYHCEEGYVLVASVHGAITSGHWGALMALAAKQKGIAGLVIDGTVRDPDEIAALPFPVFAAGVNPRQSTKRIPGALNVSITCAGVTINPGDLIVGDVHGVVALSRDECSVIIERAQQLQARENEISARLRRGEQLATLLGLEVR